MPQLSNGHVFMSYSRRDDIVMRRIVTFLRQQGIKVWVDNERLIPGTPIWEEEIEKAIQNAPAIVVVLSPDSKNSEWVRREISLADQYRKRVFPVLVRGDEETSITLRLINRQFVDIRKDEETGLNSVTASLSLYLQELDALEQKAKKEATQKTRTEKRQAKQKAEEERKKIQNSDFKIQNLEADHLAAQTAEGERLTREKVEADNRLRKAKEDADHLAMQKAKEESNSLSVQISNHKRVERERAERNSTQIKYKVGQLFTYKKIKWEALVNYLQPAQNNKAKIYILFGLAILLMSVIAILINQKSYQTTLFFSGTSEGQTDIYFYNGKTSKKITNATQGVKNWSPVFRPFGQLYFTSNRDGTAEIYRMKNDGNTEQVTNRHGKYANWAPAFDLVGQLYFTSNRDGIAEIYRMKNDGNAEQVTDGHGKYASWAPAFDLVGQLYFTSNRDGTAEIYRMKNDGNVEQVTDTPGLAGSWAPVIKGKNIFFTSNRNDYEEVFLLNETQVVAISSFESWTVSLSSRYPVSNP